MPSPTSLRSVVSNGVRVRLPPRRHDGLQALTKHSSAPGLREGRSLNRSFQRSLNRSFQLRTPTRFACTFQKLSFSCSVLVTLGIAGLAFPPFQTASAFRINGSQTASLNSRGRVNQSRNDLGTCQVTGKRLTSIDPKVARIEMDIALGCGDDDKRDCSGLTLIESKITAAIYTPESVPFPTDRKWIELIPDTTRHGRQVGGYDLFHQTIMPVHVIDPIRQARVPTALVDVIVISQWEYDFRFYSSENIGPKKNGLYTVRSSPFVIYKFKNPNPPAINRLQISKIKTGTINISEYVYDEAQDLWVLTNNGKVVTTVRSVVSSSDPCERVETHIDRYSNTTKKTIKVYRGFAWGQELVKTIEDPDGQALTTTLTFYDDPNRAHYGHLKTMTLPNGRVLHKFIPEYPR